MPRDMTCRRSCRRAALARTWGTALASCSSTSPPWRRESPVPSRTTPCPTSATGPRPGTFPGGDGAGGSIRTRGGRRHRRRRGGRRGSGAGGGRRRGRTRRLG
jgi:hypothetical protein